MLKIGGRFFCLEFSTDPLAGLRRRSTKSIRRTSCRGSARRWRSDEDSYRYLIESIERFPDMAAFAGDDRGRPASRSVKAEPILGGLVAIHSGWKI